MCIEDNPFPKRCSFYDGMQDELEPTTTFQGKIMASIEKRTIDDFAIIARLEALNKGLGLDTALERGKAYVAAGAEGVLIHHKGSDPAPVFEFAERWYAEEDVPLVCVPTTYNSVRFEDLESAGFKLVIFANYGIRSIVRSLRDTFGTIMAERRLADANDQVVSMEEVFDLIYLDELKENEARYLR
jgi:phosphoenolpyruvate phosphomutase